MRNQIIIPLLTQSPSLHAEDCRLELWNWSDIIFVGKLLYIKGSILQIVWVFTKLIIDGEVIQTILSEWFNHMLMEYVFVLRTIIYSYLFMRMNLRGPNCIKWHPMITLIHIWFILLSPGKSLTPWPPRLFYVKWPEFHSWKCQNIYMFLVCGEKEKFKI